MAAQVTAETELLLLVVPVVVLHSTVPITFLAPAVALVQELLAKEITVVTVRITLTAQVAVAVEPVVLDTTQHVTTSVVTVELAQRQR